MNPANGSTADSPWVQRGISVTRTVYSSLPVESQQYSADVSMSVSPGNMIVDPGYEYEETYYVEGELPGGHWLHYPLLVRVQIENDGFVADQPRLQVYAFGDSPVGAILNLRHAITEQFDLLESMNDKLSPRLRRQRDLLRKVLAPREAYT